MGRACSITVPASALFSSQNLLCSFILLPGPGQWLLYTSMARGGTQATSPTTLRAKQKFIAHTYTKIPVLFYTFIIIIR